MKEQEQQRNDIPMIEEYRVQAALVHASKTAKHAHILSIICIVLVLVALVCNMVTSIRTVDIFTTKDNDRTEKWINAYMDMVDKLTEAGGIDNATAEEIQQLSPQ